MEKVKKYIQYCRVATSEKEGKTALIYCRTATRESATYPKALENQLIRCVSKALEDGYQRCECVVEVGEGLSRKSQTIKRLRRVRKLARSQKFDELYITSIDRLSRDMRVVSELLSYFDKYLIKVEIVD